MTTQTDIEIWKEEARKEGLAEGRAEGRAEGEARKQREIAKALREAGTAIETISKATGLSVEQVMEL